jgi:hypothetical protein
MIVQCYLAKPWFIFADPNAGIITVFVPADVAVPVKHSPRFPPPVDGAMRIRDNSVGRGCSELTRPDGFSLFPDTASRGEGKRQRSSAGASHSEHG